MHLNNAMYYMNYGVDNIYNVSLLQGVWDELSFDIIKNCWKHTGLLQNHDDFEPIIDFTRIGLTNVENEGIEIQKATTQLVPDHARMTVSEFITQEEEDDCIDSQPSGNLVASLAEDIRQKRYGQ